MSLNDTPRANRLHIGIFGKRNAGKSSLINALTRQDIALVSPEAGTTTDPVFKAMELHPIGPVVFIDTAGFDDEGDLGQLRVERTKSVLDKTDIALLVVDVNEVQSFNVNKGNKNSQGESSLILSEEDGMWIQELSQKKIPTIVVFNKSEFLDSKVASMDERFDEELKTSTSTSDISHVWVSAADGRGIDELRHAIEQMIPEDVLREKILGDIIDENDLVMLVMPQDIQAPKGRLILPQVQTLRELLDRKCTTVSTTADGFERALDELRRPPDMIITDSQCFNIVYEKKPKECALTSFSVLFAAYKGDIGKFITGASALDDMTEKSRVLIAEACTHVPLSEDIGREKIPRILHNIFGESIEVVNVCGDDFPKPSELGGYDLIIHCGACMFNRRHVLSRIAVAEAAGVPITNYGIFLAKTAGILEKITIPE